MKLFRGLIIFSLLACSLAAWCQLANTPWPKFQNNSLNTGVGTGKGSNGQQKWSFLTGGQVLSSPAIAADGTIYVGSTDDNLYAINPDGTQKWAFTTGSTIGFSSPTISSDGTVYVGSGDHNFYAVNPDGTQKWVFPTGSFIEGSAAIASDGTIYIGSQDQNLYALNPDGSQKWVFPTPGLAIFDTPAIATDGTIYLGVGPYVYAINPDGTQKWVATTPIGGYMGSPAVGSDGTIYIGSEDHDLFAFSPAGVQLWSFPTGSYIFSTPAIGSDGTIYFGSQDGNFYAVNPNGTQKWIFATTQPITSSATISADGTIYFGADGNLYAFNPDGGQQWAFFLEETDSTAAIGSDGTLYIGAGDSNLYAVGTQVSTVPVASLTVSPTTVTGGVSSVGTVTLSTPAPVTGNVVELQSNTGAASVPPNIQIYGPNNSGTFPITTFAVASVVGATITATSGGTSPTAVLTINPPNLQSLVLNPTTIGDNQTSIATLTITSPAPAGGYVVNITDEYPASVIVPATVTVPAGATSVTFNIGSLQFSNTFQCGIYAFDGHSGKNATLTLVGDSISSIALNPSTVGGGQSSTGTVNLTSPAPPGGWVVNLSDQFPAAVGVPTSVFVPAGQSSASFTITTLVFTNVFTCGIYASDGHSAKQATLTVEGDSIASLALNPTSIGGNQTSTGTVTLNLPAPPGGWVVNVSDEYSNMVNVPTTVIVPAGATSATFTITPKQESFNFVCDIYVSDPHSAKQASLTVLGDSLASLTLNPSSVVGGTSSTGTITLMSTAPVGGWLVNLSTEYPSTDSVPATLLVPAGQISATFTITTKATTATYTAGIYSTDGNSGKNATLTITPN